MKPKVTVCIPVYNVEEFLGDCLESVINQTLSNIEIICVEDCSSDNSKKILEMYALKDPRIKVIWHYKNLGLVKTRKDAVTIAHGEYVMFVDSDDELFPNACEAAYTAIKDIQADIVEFGVITIDKEGKVIPNNFSMSEHKIHSDNKNLLDLWTEGTLKNWQIWNKIYRSDICKKAYSEMEDSYFVNAEDVYFFVVYGYYARKASVFEEELYKYRWGNGISTGFKQGNIDLEHYNSLLARKDVLDAIIRFINTKMDRGSHQSIVQYFRDNFLYGDIYLCFHYLEEKRRKEGLIAFSRKWGEEDTAEAMVWMLDNLKGTKEGQIMSLNERINQLNENNEQLNLINTALHNSLSFKIGRAITYIPRKIRDLMNS